MSRMETVKGVMKTFLFMTKQEWDIMDHKLIRIVAGLIGLAIMAFLWFYVFRGFGFFNF